MQTYRLFMQREKVLATGDEQEYRQWIEQVLQPFAARAARRDVRALFDDAHDQKMHALGLAAAESDAARLLRHLLRLRTFAETQCAQTLQQRGALTEGGRRAALQQVERDLRRIYRFLLRHGRADRYGIDLTQVSLNTFINQQRSATLCRRLRRGLQKEIRHALHNRLALFLNATPIGGQSVRQFDVEPLLQFALDKRLEHVDDSALYEMFVEEQLRRAMAAASPPLPPGDAEAIRQRSDDLGPEQFELMSGSAAAQRPILTENNQTCIGPCAKPRKDSRKVCRTAPYRKFGLQYTWDYCD